MAESSVGKGEITCEQFLHFPQTCTADTITTFYNPEEKPY